LKSINVTKRKLLYENKEEIQDYIDIISMNPEKPSYQKYKKILNDKFGIDYDKKYGKQDVDLINNASLKDIKSKKDFLNFENYREYAKTIYRLRDLGSNEPKHIDKEIKFNIVELIASKLDFKVSVREYNGHGNYAQVSLDKLEVPSVVNINVLIHELGHIYHYKYYKEGIASTITYASSSYGIQHTSEVFAENFMHFFTAPQWLKSNLPEVYNDLNIKIKPIWKKIINALINM